MAPFTPDWRIQPLGSLGWGLAFRSRIPNNGPMELRHLRAFVTLAEEKHFGRAAELLGVSAPTLTEQIQALERSVRIKLVERTSRSVTLTAPGRSFLVEAEAALRHARAALLAAQTTERGNSGKLEIGYMLIASVIGIVPSLIGEFCRQNPSVDINLHRIEMTDQQQGILEGELDLGIVKTPTELPTGLSCFEIVTLPYAAVLPAGHRLANRHEIEPWEIIDEDFVSLSADAEVSFWRNISIVTGGAEPRIRKRAPDILSLLNLVAAGFGVSISAHQLSRMNIPGIVFVPIRSPELNSISVLYRKNDRAPLTVALRSFMKSRTDLLTLS